jgi:hypothetical protein
MKSIKERPELIEMFHEALLSPDKSVKEEVEKIRKKVIEELDDFSVLVIARLMEHALGDLPEKLGRHFIVSSGAINHFRHHSERLLRIEGLL